MNAKLNALERVRTAHKLLQNAQGAVNRESDHFADICREARELGLNDREIAEATGYSRARIQQFRQGDPRKRGKK